MIELKLSVTSSKMIFNDHHKKEIAKYFSTKIYLQDPDQMHTENITD